MKTARLAFTALAAGLLIAGSAAADDQLKLATAKGCTACHGVDKKIVGPAFKDVAKKYKGDAKAAATLAEKVEKGGSGVWGQVPMPPNKVSDDEAKKLVAWILEM